MKIFKCDFCDKCKPCTVTTIDNVDYDICVECKAERVTKLNGKGEPTSLQTITTTRRGRRWSDYSPLYPIWVQPYYVPLPINPLPLPNIIYMTIGDTPHDVATNGGVQCSYTSNGPLNANNTLMLKQ